MGLDGISSDWMWIWLGSLVACISSTMQLDSSEARLLACFIGLCDDDYDDDDADDEDDGDHDDDDGEETIALTMLLFDWGLDHYHE